MASMHRGLEASSLKAASRTASRPRGFTPRSLEPWGLKAPSPRSLQASRLQGSRPNGSRPQSLEPRGFEPRDLAFFSENSLGHWRFKFAGPPYRKNSLSLCVNESLDFFHDNKRAHRENIARSIFLDLAMILATVGCSSA